MATRASSTSHRPDDAVDELELEFSERGPAVLSAVTDYVARGETEAIKSLYEFTSSAYRIRQDSGTGEQDIAPEDLEAEAEESRPEEAALELGAVAVGDESKADASEGDAMSLRSGAVDLKDALPDKPVGRPRAPVHFFHATHPLVQSAESFSSPGFLCSLGHLGLLLRLSLKNTRCGC